MGIFLCPQFVPHGLSSPRAEDQSLQKRVACQAIGAMNPSAGSLASGIKTWHIAAPVKVCLYSAHQVMCRWPHWNEIFGDIEFVLCARLVNAWKAPAQVFGIEMSHVKIDNCRLCLAIFK